MIFFQAPVFVLPNAIPSTPTVTTVSVISLGTISYRDMIDLLTTVPYIPHPASSALLSETEFGYLSNCHVPQTLSSRPIGYVNNGPFPSQLSSNFSLRIIANTSPGCESLTTIDPAMTQLLSLFVPQSRTVRDVCDGEEPCVANTADDAGEPVDEIIIAEEGENQEDMSVKQQ